MTLVFIDTETTSLRHDRRAWDIALIVRRDGQPDHEQQWFVRRQDLDLANADLKSLQIGRFHDRQPQYAGGDGRTLTTEFEALMEVERLTRGAHLVGAVPNFDADVLGQRMRAHGICPSWHYHLIDVETLAVGWIAGMRSALEADYRDLPTLPWNSEELSRVVGVEPADDEHRHTALGDARWARDLYDAIMGGAK